MADFGDKALEAADLFFGVAMANHANKPNKKLPSVGYCHHCAEKVENMKIFCDSDCAQNYDREAWLREQRNVESK